eukprot:3625338-Amphidinium_carterae.1
MDGGCAVRALARVQKSQTAPRHGCSQGPPSLQAQLERAQQLLEEGLLLRKASAALGDSRLVTQIDTAIVKDMESKHPQQRQADVDTYECLRRIDRGAASKVEAALFFKCLGSFPVDSAPGASGLRPSHLKAACDPEHKDSVIKELAKVINAMLAGSVPEQVQQWLMGGNLTVLTKPGGS